MMKTGVAATTDSERVMRNKEVLTTGEVAKICHVAPRTVSKWFDTGKLRGYRIPGSRDRRIPVSQLIQFMRVHGIPLGGLEGNVIRVLLVNGDRTGAAEVEGALLQTERYELRTAVNDFEAGMLAEKFRPHVVLVDVVSDAVDAREILKNLRGNPDLSAAKVVAMGGAFTQGQTDALLREGFDLALSRPHDTNRLLQIVEQATDLVA